MPDSARFGTRPEVTVDGTPLRDDLAGHLVRVVVDTNLHLPDMVELCFRDPQRDALSRAQLRIGSVVTVSTTRAGDGQQRPLVTAEVTALEHDYSEAGAFTIARGYDHAHRLSRGRVTTSYNDVTDGDVVRQVARRCGLDVGTVDDDGPTHSHIAQVNATDWDFLMARAREAGRELVVRDGKLEWRRHDDAADSPDEAEDVERSADPTRLALGTNVIRFRPRVTAAAQVSEVEVRGWDPVAKRAVVARTSAQTVSASTAASPAQLAGSFSAPAYVTVDRPLTSEAEAQATAQAVAESLASVHAEAEGVANGDPKLVAGTPVSIAMAGPQFDGRYVLTTAKHVYDEHGYRVHFTVSGRQERSLLGLTSGGTSNNGHRAGGPPVPGVVVAQVTDVDDPDKQGRVKVSFPWLADDYESWWARVTQLGAGPDRGAVWLPEVNDEVLVAFDHGDSRMPYVVGQLWNGVDTPPLGDGLVDGTTGAVKRRGFVSRLGHRLVFLDDDSKSGIAALTADDALKIALDATSTQIRITSDGTVEITGAQGITVKSDAAISVEAGSTLDLKAKSGVTIDGGPSVSVSGSVVKLN